MKFSESILKKFPKQQILTLIPIVFLWYRQQLPWHPCSPRKDDLLSPKSRSPKGVWTLTPVWYPWRMRRVGTALGARAAWIGEIEGSALSSYARRVIAIVTTHHFQQSVMYFKWVRLRLFLYLVCCNTMCVSICQVDYLLLRTCLALYFTTTE